MSGLQGGVLHKRLKIKGLQKGHLGNEEAKPLEIRQFALAAENCVAG